MRKILNIFRLDAGLTVVLVLIVASAIGPLLASCAALDPGAPAPLDTNLVAPLMLDVCDRHDHYVMADDSLSQLEKETFFRSAEILRRAIAEARGEGATPAR